MKTMKANLIFGKKQIILASLVLILSAAVYLNWQFASSNEDLTLANATADQLETDILTKSETVLNGTQELLSDETGLTVPDEAVANKATDTEAVADKGVTDTNAKATDTAAKDSAIVNTSDKAKATDTEVTPTASEGEKTKNFGDTLFVSAKTVSNEGYFAMATLARSKSRDEVTETLATILNDEKLSEGDKKDVSAKALALTDIIEAESRIENLIKAKGFEECVVYLSDGRANVVVKTPGLDQNSATQIKNIIVSEYSIKGENVAITEIN